MLPVLPSRVSNRFGSPGRYASRADVHGRAGHHTGIDFGSAWPVPINGRIVRSVLPAGHCVISEYNSTMGNWVGVYNAERDLLVTYWHLSQRKVKVGDWVLPWQEIGRVGSTGNSTAPHLHVQVNFGRSFNYHGHVDPELAFSVLTRTEAKRQHDEALALRASRRR